MTALFVTLFLQYLTLGNGELSVPMEDDYIGPKRPTTTTTVTPRPTTRPTTTYYGKRYGIKRYEP